MSKIVAGADRPLGPNPPGAERRFRLPLRDWARKVPVGRERFEPPSRGTRSEFPGSFQIMTHDEPPVGRGIPPSSPGSQPPGRPGFAGLAAASAAPIYSPPLLGGFSATSPLEEERVWHAQPGGLGTPRFSTSCG